MKELNTSFYSGADMYSDGDVEDEILEYIKENEPEEYDKVLSTDQRFPVFYHLSDYRKHLLDWYPFDKDSVVLEIGGGMGAFTGMLCKRCGKVVTVELSKKRAEAIRHRCRNFENLQIFVGDLMEMHFEEKFDYITLIGVLEYQSKYSNLSNPQQSFLENISSLLKPEGKLIIAIENKMGLKYWCGDVEDHCGIPFSSINNYEFGGRARTFDRAELFDLIKNSGYLYSKWYYPLPDYKFPRVIYSDDMLPTRNVNDAVVPMYYASTFYSQLPIVVNERTAYLSITRNDVFPFFANSFLVECSKEKLGKENIKFVATAAERKNKYLIQTIIKGNVVKKYALSNEGKQHIKTIYENAIYLQTRGVKILEHMFEGDELITPLQKFPTVEEIIIDLIVNQRTDEVNQLIDKFYENIRLSSDEIQDDWLQRYNISKRQGLKIDFKVQEKAYCDMIFSNCFYDNENLLFYDQEWTYDCIPASFTIYRALKILYSSNNFLNVIYPFELWLQRYSLSELKEYYDELEAKLFSSVQDDTICSIVGKLRYLPQNTIEDNIHMLTLGKNELFLANNDLNAFKRGYEQQKKDILTLEGALSQRQKDVSVLEEALSQRQKDVSVLEEALSQRQKDVSVLEEALSQRQKDVSVLEEALSQRQKDVSVLEEALSQRQKDVSVLEEFIVNKNMEMEKIQNQVEFLENKIRNLSLKEFLRIVYNRLRKKQ